MAETQFRKMAAAVFGPAMFALLTVALVFAYRVAVGPSRPVALLIVISAIASVPSMGMYPSLVRVDGKQPTRSHFASLVALSVMIPYALACYLVFYEGAWGLVQLFGHFNISALLWSVTCGYLGWVIVDKLHQLTEMCKAVEEQRIILRSSPP